MTTRIFKHPLEIGNRQAVVMPQGAKILWVAEQHGDPVLWASARSYEKGRMK